MGARILYPSVFEPFEIGSLRLRNRVIMAPMGNNLSSREGEVTSKTIAHYVRRAEGGVGMILTEAVPVSEEGKHRANCLCLYQPQHERALGELVTRVHEAGAKIGIQLHHAGALADPAVNGGRTVSASAIKIEGRPLPEPLEEDGIRRIVGSFERAARQAVKIGFDAIEIHGAHGYLLHQFFSWRTNLRKDAYGGSLENRMRFPLEVAKAVREAVGNSVPVFYRISAIEGKGVGYSIEESLVLGHRLKEAGVDALDVSAGSSESYQLSVYVTQPYSLPEGALADIIARFKKDVSIPVIGVGRISRPETADRLLREGKMDLVALGRALLADPLWCRKAKGELPGPIRPCIACNRCIETISKQLPITCSVNPLLGSEDAKLAAGPKKRKIVVVGGGPSGMQAAIAGASLGNSVVLYERSTRLGGSMLEASLPPYKAALKELLRYLEEELKRLDVKVILDMEADEDVILRERADVVVLGTGAKPIMPKIEGLEGSSFMLSAKDVLREEARVGRRAAIVGGGMVGCETAEYLATRGRKVVLIEMAERIATDMEPRSRLLLVERLEKLKVKIFTGHEVKAGKATEEGLLLVIRSREGKDTKLLVDSLIIAVGFRPEKSLSVRLKQRGIEPVEVGDCKRVGNIKEAIHQGFWWMYENIRC